MNKRDLLKYGIRPACAALAITGMGYPAFASSSYFTVPAGMTKINIKSWVNGAQVLDYTMNVSPGQIFMVTPEK